MLRFVVIAVLLGLLRSPPAWADFADGLRAFDAGDYAAALAAWQPLAEAGDADAQAALAGLHLQGLGVAGDAARAAALYRQAARQGHVMAQLNLGDLYRRGIGVRRDPIEAYRWLALAAGQGHPWAQARLAELAQTLSPAALSEARRRAVLPADAGSD